MASFNCVLLIGNVTRDPEIRYVGANKTAVCDLGLAVNERVKKGNDWVNEVVFVDCTLWGRTAEVAGQYITKGSPVLIDGKLRTEAWEKDGKKFTKLKVVAESMQMLGSREEKPAAKAPEAYSGPSDDSIPF